MSDNAASSSCRVRRDDTTSGKTAEPRRSSLKLTTTSGEIASASVTGDSDVGSNDKVGVGKNNDEEEFFNLIVKLATANSNTASAPGCSDADIDDHDEFLDLILEDGYMDLAWEIME